MTQIYLDPDGDKETDFIMEGDRAWITITNPDDPTQKAHVLISLANKCITTTIWSDDDNAESEDGFCCSFWEDLVILEENL